MDLNKDEHTLSIQRCKKWEIREIYLCYFFLASANFWATHAKICTSASSTSAISTCGISTGTMSTSSISTIRLRLCYFSGFYGWLAIYGVLLQSRICRNLRFFGANFFGQKCISAIFITFCISVQCHSLLLGHYETADLPPAPLSEGDLLISIHYLLSQIDR